MHKILAGMVILAAVLFSGCTLPEGNKRPVLEAPAAYKVSYDGNGSTGGTVPTDAKAYVSGANVTMRDTVDILVKSGFKFNGWTITSDGSGPVYTAPGSFKITEDITFYAKWLADSVNTYTVSYDGNGADSGSVPLDFINYDYASGQKAIVFGNRASLAKTGNCFLGWKIGTDTTVYTAGNKISATSNTTFVAVWGPTRIFTTRNMKTGAYDPVTATQKAEATHCIVFVDSAVSTVTDSFASSIAAEFDANIYEKITGSFGDESDVDDNGKVILLLLDIQDGYAGSGGYVAGFFDPTNEFSTSTYSDSNQADMLFLDLYPSPADGSVLKETAAHEFQHLINFSNTVLVDGTNQDVWINEGLSSGAESIYTGLPIQDKITYFNEDPAKTIRQGNNFFVWNGYWESSDGGGDILADYSTVYLFFQWLRIHAENGTAIYKDIISSSHRDYQAVTEAAAARISANFASWPNLLSTWMTANMFNNPTGFKGYKQELGTIAMLGSYSAGNAQKSLYPGEGVWSLMPASLSSNTPPAGGANIRYLGITRASGAIDTTGPAYSGDVSLVYNANSNNNDIGENGFVASVSEAARFSMSALDSVEAARFSLRALDSVEAAQSLPSSYPISIQLTPGGGLSKDSHRVQAAPPSYSGARTAGSGR